VKRARRGRLVAGAALVALAAGGVGGAIGAHLERDGGIGGNVTLPQASAEQASRAPGSIAGIAARALPGVVTIHVRGGEDQGTGTGFVLDKRGHILTNNHVVEPAGADGAISVTFNGGQTAKATVVGRDSGYDLAVIKVTGVSGLTPLPLGNSDSVQVGDSVVAIGAPFDLAGTVTTGIISAKERPITAGGEKRDGSDVSYVDALQTDAPIDHGSSGSPVADQTCPDAGSAEAVSETVDPTVLVRSGLAGFGAVTRRLEEAVTLSGTTIAAVPPALSVTSIATRYRVPAPMVPLTVPVLVFKLRPGGRPVAVHVYGVSPPPASAPSA